MPEEDSPTQLRHRLRLGLADDGDFDALYAGSIRARSSQFWTPVAVATRAAHLIARHEVRRVLDVGSGPGKFCLTAACAHPEVAFTGVEQRLHLVEAARRAGTVLGVENVSFLTGDVTNLPWAEFDGLYLFNPFAENVYARDEQFDDTVELSTSKYCADIRRVRAALTAATPGMVMVTYHGTGGPIPGSYELVHAERAHSDWLRVWVKRRPDDGGTFYLEDGDDLLIVSVATDVTVTTRIPDAL
jgi:predicted RNA methylase